MCATFSKFKRITETRFFCQIGNHLYIYIYIRLKSVWNEKIGLKETLLIWNNIWKQQQTFEQFNRIISNIYLIFQWWLSNKSKYPKTEVRYARAVLSNKKDFFFFKPKFSFHIAMHQNGKIEELLYKKKILMKNCCKTIGNIDYANSLRIKYVSWF